MKGMFRLNADGKLFITKELNYKAAYEDTLDQALDVMQKFAGLTKFTKLPHNESEPLIGLRYLEEWCYTNSQKMADEPLLDYRQLAKRLYTDLNDYTRTQTQSDLYKDSDKVNTTYLKANFDSMDDVVFGLQDNGFTDKAEALKKAIENVRKAVKTHDKGEITGTDVKVHVAYLIKELDALCRPAAPKKPAETRQENKAINKPNDKSHKIFGDKFELPWGPSINYKNLWHKIKNWPSVARRIKKIRKLFRR